MNRRLLTLLAIVLLGCLSVAAEPIGIGPAPNLTGLYVFGSSSTGMWDSNAAWDTLPYPDTTWKIYVKQGTEWLNSGYGDAVGINVPMQLGRNEFLLFAEGWGGDYANWGMNAFFDGNLVNPSISVYAPEQTDAVAPAFYANSNSSTPTMADDPWETPGAGTLAFQVGYWRVELIEYSWAHPSVYNMDVVSAHAILPSGRADFVGHIAFDVVDPEPLPPSVPEPGTLLLLGSGLLASARVFRRKRA